MLNKKRSIIQKSSSNGNNWKNNFLRQFSRYHHKNQGAEDNFHSWPIWSWTVLLPSLSTQIILFSNKIRRVFVPKFYYEKRARNFLKHLVYVGEHGPNKTRCEYPEGGTKYYEYKKSTDVSSKSTLPTDSDWHFPETYCKSIGTTVGRLGFFFWNLSDSLIHLIQPSSNLINTESGTEETSTIPTQYSFYPDQQKIEENIKKYNNVPQKYFINESYFLYNKSDLMKEIHVTAFNKKISVYGSISYLKKKQKMRYLK